MGPFPQDEDGKSLLTFSFTKDPFSKWVEAHANALTAQLEDAAEFLYNDLVASWGKLRYIWTDNGTKFAGQLCMALQNGWALSIIISLLATIRPMGI